jgi:hypothetical protein
VKDSSFLNFPSDCILYGFAFAEKLQFIDMREVYDNLEKITDLKNVVFSTFDDEGYGHVWLVAADRYLDETEIQIILDYLAEHNIEEEFCMTKFRGV